MNTFPDARVVVLHRDPAQTVPSVSYLAEAMLDYYWQPYTWERRSLGRFAIDLYLTMTQRLMKYRDAHPEKAPQFLDIKYTDLEADPIGQVQRIYQNFDISYEPSMTARMQAHLSEHKKHKYGKPDYSLARYGVTAEEIETGFAEYIFRYLR